MDGFLKLIVENDVFIYSSLDKEPMLITMALFNEPDRKRKTKEHDN